MVELFIKSGYNSGVILIKLWSDSMSSAKWKMLYGKELKNRPGINEIMSFLPGDVSILFQEFSRYLFQEYDIACSPPIFTKTDGWVYSFGRYNVYLLNHISIEDDAFSVQGIPINNKESLQRAIKVVDSLYNDYQVRLKSIIAVKKEKQKQNSKRRLEHERSEREALAGMIDKERFNQYRWSPKISRQKLKNLYKSDTQGFADEELVDDVGYTLYTRCLQGRDETLLIRNGKIKCHHCGKTLEFIGMDALVSCSCGYQYLLRDYMRSFRKNNMPSGAATAIFNAFIEDWPRAKGYSEKMRLVDRLIHEFHINLNSGVQGRFVGINLIEGSKKQIGDLINDLAYEKSDTIL